MTATMTTTILQGFSSRLAGAGASSMSMRIGKSAMPNQFGTSARRFIHQDGAASSEMDQILTQVNKFVKEEVIPNAAHYDRAGEYPWPTIRKAHALGLMSTDLPTELGGLDLRLAEKILIYEAIGYGDTAVGTSMMVSELAQAPLLHAGSKHLREKYLGRMLGDEPMIASYAVTECNAGSDLASLKTTATLEGSSSEAHYILNGSKAWITNAGVANWYFVLAKTTPGSNQNNIARSTTPPEPVKKISATGKSQMAFTGFIVESGWKGITVGKKEPLVGQRCSDTRSVLFENVRVPSENVVGTPGQGFELALRAFDRTRPIIAALACGLAQRSLDESIAYARERRTFGRRIGEHEAVGFKLADMAMRLEAARQLARTAASKVDAGAGDASRYASMAKCFAAEQAFDAAVNAVQIHGANGLTSDYPVEKLLRDSRVLQIYGGTSEIQRLVISRSLLAADTSEVHSKL